MEGKSPENGTQIPEQIAKEPIPVYNVSLRPEVASYMFSGVRQEYARRLEMMRTDRSNTPTSFISDEIQASDEVRLAREGATILEQAEKEGATKVTLALTDPDISILKKYLNATGPKGRLRIEMLKEFDDTMRNIKNAERARNLARRLKSLLRQDQ